MTDNILKILDSVINDNEPRSFRDPQEYIFAQPGNEASDVYSYGMMLFKKISGKDYFETVGIPEDEFFMSCDTENDFPVISAENIPSEYSDISQLLCRMTMFRRESRISVKEISEMLKKDDIPEENRDSNENICLSQEKEFPALKNGSDYGIIVNNKRCGRIEFIKLYDSKDNTAAYYDIPVTEREEFTFPVSCRSSEYQEITNPSSVYGDCIIPAALIKAKTGKCHSVRITFKKENENLIPVICAADINGNIIKEIDHNNVEIIPYRK